MNELLLVVLVFGFGGLLRLVFSTAETTDQWVSFWLIGRQRRSRWISYETGDSMVEGTYGYPSLQHFLISRLPKRFWGIAGRVSNLCLATAKELDITDTAICRDVQLSALLHDIGKIGIPDAILLKPAKLTPDEFAVIRNHTKIGAGIVRHVPGLEGVTQAILHHHERFDGLGYPAGLSGDAIPIASALIAVADAFDAMTSDRPYRAACACEVALDELDRHKGTQFNPRVVDAFTRVIRREMDQHNSDHPNLTGKQPAMVTLPLVSAT